MVTHDYNVNTQEAEAEELQIQRQAEQHYKILSQKTTKRGNAMNSWKLLLCACEAFLSIVTNGLNFFIIPKQTVVGHLLCRRYYTGPSPCPWVAGTTSPG